MLYYVSILPAIFPVKQMLNSSIHYHSLFYNLAFILTMEVLLYLVTT